MLKDSSQPALSAVGPDSITGVEEGIFRVIIQCQSVKNHNRPNVQGIPIMPATGFLKNIQHDTLFHAIGLLRANRQSLPGWHTVGTIKGHGLQS
jgi:hypothetical protein